MQMQGWIKLYRELSDHWLWDDKPFSKGQAWIDMLLRANHKSATILVGTSLIELNAGEFVTSKKKLYEFWGWSNSKLDTFISLLEKDKMIAVKKHTNKIVIKVLNYTEYQGSIKELGAEKAQQEHSEYTAHQQSLNNEPTIQAQSKHTNKNVKNIKNIKNENKNLTCSSQVRTLLAPSDANKSVSGAEADFSAQEPARPSLSEIEEFILSENLNCNAEDFLDYYSANGWMVGHTPMKNWHAMCRKWSRRERKNNTPSDKLKSSASYNLAQIKKAAADNTEI